jgi:hypothetical protein
MLYPMPRVIDAWPFFFLRQIQVTYQAEVTLLYLAVYTLKKQANRFLYANSFHHLGSINDIRCG